MRPRSDGVSVFFQGTLPLGCSEVLALQVQTNDRSPNLLLSRGLLGGLIRFFTTLARAFVELKDPDLTWDRPVENGDFFCRLKAYKFDL